MTGKPGTCRKFLQLFYAKHYAAESKVKTATMSQPFQLQIAEPCHENWDNMSAAQQGRFCGSCQKTVVDFSRMTDDQVMQYFKNYTGNTCGRFDTEQLNKQYATPPPPKSGWHKWALAMLASGIFFSAKAQPKPDKTKPGETCTKEPSMLRMGKVAPNYIPVEDRMVKGEIAVKQHYELNGRVTDEAGNGIPYASVQLKNEKWGVSADSLGNFTLKINLFDPNVILNISSVGFKADQRTVNLFETKGKKQLFMLDADNELPPVAIKLLGTTSCSNVTSVRRTSIMGAVEMITTKKLNIISPTPQIPVNPAPVINTYPNPVTPGGTIKIDIQEAGNYELQLCDISGKTLLVQHFSISQKRQPYNIIMPASAKPGAYFIKVINKKDLLSATSEIIVSD